LQYPRDILATTLLVFVVLIPFFFAKGRIEVLGKDEIKKTVVEGSDRGVAAQPIQYEHRPN